MLALQTVYFSHGALPCWQPEHEAQLAAGASVVFDLRGNRVELHSLSADETDADVTEPLYIFWPGTLSLVCGDGTHHHNSPNHNVGHCSSRAAAHLAPGGTHAVTGEYKIPLARGSIPRCPQFFSPTTDFARNVSHLAWMHALYMHGYGSTCTCNIGVVALVCLLPCVLIASARVYIESKDECSSPLFSTRACVFAVAPRVRRPFPLLFDFTSIISHTVRY